MNVYNLNLVKLHGSRTYSFLDVLRKRSCEPGVDVVVRRNHEYELRVFSCVRIYAAFDK